MGRRCGYPQALEQLETARAIIADLEKDGVNTRGLRGCLNVLESFIGNPDWSQLAENEALKRIDALQRDVGEIKQFFSIEVR